MSTSFLTRPIGRSAKAKAADAPVVPEAPARTGAAGPVRGGGLLVAPVPKADLMPPEVQIRRRQLHLRRRLRLGLVGVIAFVILGAMGSWAFAFLSQSELQAAQQQQQEQITRQAGFSDVRNTQSSVGLAQAAQKVGASTEIDWQAYLQNLQATLPSGVTIQNVTIDSATPFAAYAQSTVPLQGERIATLTFTAASPTLPSIPAWLDGLSTLKGFVDATPGSVTLNDDHYVANIVMHINSDALSQRFDTQKDAAK
jgi:hypothetical protein